MDELSAKDAMMRSMFLVMFFLVSNPLFANLEQEVDRCFDQNSNTHAALRCSQKVLARGIEFGGSNGQNSIALQQGRYRFASGSYSYYVFITVSGNQVTVSEGGDTWNGTYSCDRFNVCLDPNDTSIKLEIEGTTNFVIRSTTNINEASYWILAQ